MTEKLGEPQAEHLRYGLDARLPVGVVVLAALQWLLFMLPFTALVPLVLSHLLHLPAERTAVFINQALLVTALASIVQVLLGHHLPLTEGQAGLWWAVFIAMVSSAETFGYSGIEMMRNLEGGLMAAGLMVTVIGLLRLARHVRSWFGPAVTGTFLVLLSIQISSTLIPGALGATDNGVLQPAVALVSILILVSVLTVNLAGPGLSRSFAVLIGLAGGWAIFALLGWTEPVSSRSPLLGVSFLQVFPWSSPGFDTGVLLVCIVTGIVNLGNIMGALVAMEHVLGRRLPPDLYDRATAWSGLSHVLAGAGGVIGTSPFAAAAGVVAVSGIGARIPFLVGSVLLLLLGSLPGLGAWFATLPLPVGDAVLLVLFTQMLGFGLTDIGRLGLTQRDVYRVGLPILVGTGLIALPPATFSAIPPAFRPLFANATIVGTLLALGIDRLIARQKG